METWALYMSGKCSVAERIPRLSFSLEILTHLLRSPLSLLCTNSRQWTCSLPTQPPVWLRSRAWTARPPVCLATFQRGFHTHFTGWHIEFQGFYTIRLSLHTITSFQNKTLYLWTLDQNPAMTGHWQEKARVGVRWGGCFYVGKSEVDYEWQSWLAVWYLPISPAHVGQPMKTATAKAIDNTV